MTRLQPDSPSQTERVLFALRQLVLSGELAAGTRLTELGLVARLGASRTPVRHALAALAHEGLVDELPRGGYRIRAFAIQDVFDLLELRAVLEGTAARLAAERLSAPEDLDRLTILLDAMGDVEERARASGDAYFDGLSPFFDINEEFHGEIRRLSRNGPLIKTIGDLLPLPFTNPRFLLFSYAAPDAKTAVMGLAQAQHRGIVDAIRAGAAVRAEELMREHALLPVQTLQNILADADRMKLLPSRALLDLSTTIR